MDASSKDVPDRRNGHITCSVLLRHTGVVGSSGAALPRTFGVGAVLHNVQGGGRLFVAPGRLELRPGPATRKVSGVEVVRHSVSRVEAYRARLLPPWMSCSIVVSDGIRRVLATFPLWTRRSLFAALSSAGFEVSEKVTLIEHGYERMTFG